jgi:hypothetical protein
MLRKTSSTLLFVLAVPFSNPAHAIERQHHLGLAPALAILKIEDKSTTSTGLGGGLHYAYGLTDQFNLMIEASSAIVAKDQQQDSPESPRTRPAAVDHAAVGAGYVIDILTWVPYIGLLGGGYRLDGGTLPEALIIPGLSVAAGVDYQLSRHLAVGIGAREHLMISKLSTYPSYTTVLLRFEYMWGF